MLLRHRRPSVVISLLSLLASGLNQSACWSSLIPSIHPNRIRWTGFCRWCRAAALRGTVVVSTSSHHAQQSIFWNHSQLSNTVWSVGTMGTNFLLARERLFRASFLSACCQVGPHQPYTLLIMLINIEGYFLLQAISTLDCWELERRSGRCLNGHWKCGTNIPLVCNLFGLNLLHRQCNSYLLTLTRRSRRRVLRLIRHVIRVECLCWCKSRCLHCTDTGANFWIRYMKSYYILVCREGWWHALMCSSLPIQHSASCAVEPPFPMCVAISCTIFFSSQQRPLSSLPSPSSMMSRVVSRQLVLFCANQHVSMKVLQREAEFAIAVFISDWRWPVLAFKLEGLWQPPGYRCFCWCRCCKRWCSESKFLNLHPFHWSPLL